MKKSLLILVLLVTAARFNGQEGLRPLSGNINYHYQDLTPQGPKKQINYKGKALIGSQLPFKEDFSYSPTSNFPNPLLWSDSSVYINSGFGIAPPSIGVATFDGLNKYGYPYTPNLTNMSMSLPADFLTSQPINLKMKGTKALQPTDSVAITFYYQARGRGDNPEQTDSLILDFYKPNQGKWEQRMWHVRGNSSPNTNDTVFKRGFVYISDTSFLQENFRFRFRNRATTAGDFDHWHLDYINLDELLFMSSDTVKYDIAFGYVPTPFLTNYSSMPAKQYVPAERANKNSVFIRNNSSLGANMTYESRMYEDATSALTYTYNGGANPALLRFKYRGWDSIDAHARPVFTHTFAPFVTDSIDFRIKHYIYRDASSTGTEFSTDNDTVLQYQRFRNYYAFDDGSAEGGYYILGAGGRMVQNIKVNVGDTLRALRIYFDPVGNYTSTYKFRMNVWNDNGAGAPGILIHVDSSVTNVVKHYTVSPRPSSPEYVFQKPIYLSPGNYFIGFQQLVATGITVGFDKNINHADRLWFDSGSGWTQSSIYGSVMMRAVFGPKIPAPVGIKENVFSKSNFFIAYPNPANNDLNIELTANAGGSYSLINSIGQIMKSGSLENSVTSIQTEDIANGVYFLTVKINDLAPQCSKIIIQH
jgi:hypothetical protein